MSETVRISTLEGNASFATETGNRRDEEGARLADGCTAAFFAEHLG